MSTIILQHTRENIHGFLHVLMKLRYFEEIMENNLPALSPKYLEQARERASSVKVLYDITPLEKRFSAWLEGKGALELNEEESKIVRHCCDILYEYYSRYELNIERSSTIDKFILAYKSP